MISKIKIVYNNNPGDFNRATLSQWSQDFEPVPFDPDTKYSPANTIIWTDYMADNTWCEPFQQSFKIVCNYHWDFFEDEVSQVQENVLHFRPRRYAWLFEYMTYCFHNYKNLIKPSNPDHFLLLLMNLRRDLRDDLYAKLEPYEAHSLISYVGRGKRLPGDLDFSPGQVFQRHFNPDWYAGTCFSLVSETFNLDRLYISEKSFKPLAFQHPFVIYGTLGNLHYLHQHGFVSFDHVIDQSYDSTQHAADRLNMILQLLDSLYQDYQKGLRPFQDTETQQRVVHNYHRFYDKSNFDAMWRTDIVDPIKEFLNS